MLGARNRWQLLTGYGFASHEHRYDGRRHAGNMLVRRPRAGGSSSAGLARLAEARLELCPIDHGFCLPEALEPPYLEWLHWPQVRPSLRPLLHCGYHVATV